MKNFSQTAMDQWEQCALLYKLANIDRAPQGPSDSLIMGRALHKTLQEDGETFIRSGGKFRLPLFALTSLYAGALDKEIMRGDPGALLTRATVDAMRLKGLAALREYTQAIQPYYAPEETEKRFEFPIAGLQDWQFVGRRDARMTLVDGSPGVIDFKFGKPWPANVEGRKEQANAYLLAEQAEGRDPPAKTMVFIVFGLTQTVKPARDLPAGSYLCEADLRVTRRTGGQLQHYMERAKESMQAIDWATKRNVFEPRPNHLCAWCGYLGRCPQGLRHLMETGKQPAVAVLKAE